MVYIFRCKIAVKKTPSYLAGVCFLHSIGVCYGKEALRIDKHRNHVQYIEKSENLW
jgi:hypothetical protein